MSKYYNCCFVSNTVFDNGKIDPNEHPAIIIGNDDKYTYYFMGTTNQKRNNLESPERIKYKNEIEYQKLDGDNKEVFINIPRTKCGNINTTYIKKMNNCEANKITSTYGSVKESYVDKLVMKWFLQQNEIFTEKEDCYDVICNMFQLNEDTKQSSEYQELLCTLNSCPQEKEWHIEYEKERYLYLEIIGNIILYNNHTESEPMSFDMVHYPTLPCDGETILPFFVEKDREIIKKRLDWDRKHRPCLPYYERKYEEVTDKVYDLLVKEKK